MYFILKPNSTLIAISVIGQGIIERIQSKVRKDKGFKEIFENISWLFFDKALRLGVGFFLTALIARQLGTDLFGIWNYAIAFVALFSVFSTLGLDNIVVKELVKDERKHEEILGAAFILKLLGGFVGIFCSLVAISYLRVDDKQIFTIVSIIASGFIFQSFDIIDYFFQSRLKSKLTVYARNAAFLLGAVIKVVLLLYKVSLIYYVTANVFELAFASIFLILVYNKKEQSVFRWIIRFDTIKWLLKESFPLLFAGMVILIYMRTDQIMLGEMIGDSEVGIFSAAVRLSEVWYFVPLVITNSLLPSIVKAKELTFEEYENKVQNSFNIMATLGIVTAAVVSVASYLIISVVFGNEYLNAAPILSIHTWTSVFVFIGFASGNWFVVENLQKFVFYRTLAGAVINVVLNYILIPKYGGIGAAFATLVSQFVASYFFNLFNKRTLPVFKMQTLALLRASGLYFIYKHLIKLK
ncbi:flippase [Pontibacter silvestris]|uniref:Flippase n=1 Tax=Pontibacter silvestris TaxID=2305183 RepID=A0ABW4WSE9_9BACT|nr:flippase [Pontibacter silvestris]MCC9137785.1 flippase [Pontibacter silvestris]